MSSQSFFRGLVTGVVLAALAAFAWLHHTFNQVQQNGGFLTSQGTGNVRPFAEKIATISDLFAQSYVDPSKIDHHEMEDNALKGYVEALGDPHTEYLTVKENEFFSEDMHGSQHFEGIGAVVTKKKDGIMITEVLKGSPSFVAGLQPLDLIVQIDGTSTKELSLSDAVDKIRGPKGTSVKLSVFREHPDAEPELFDIDVKRNTIDVPSVNLSLVQTGGKNYLLMEVSIFGEDTIATLRKELLQLTGSYQGVILDLRGNGGGYLPTAVELASFFLPKNEVVTTAKYSIFADETFRSAGFGDFVKKPIVVLVDALSASASEIVAGALQQRAGGILVGTKTFGKGSIQTVHELGDGSIVKYTIGKRYLPNGETIDQVGIKPNKEVEFDRASFASGGADMQLQKALEIIQNSSYWNGTPCCT